MSLPQSRVLLVRLAESATELARFVLPASTSKPTTRQTWRVKSVQLISTCKMLDWIEQGTRRTRIAKRAQKEDFQLRALLSVVGSVKQEKSCAMANVTIVLPDIG